MESVKSFINKNVDLTKLFAGGRMALIMLSKRLDTSEWQILGVNEVGHQVVSLADSDRSIL